MRRERPSLLGDFSSRRAYTETYDVHEKRATALNTRRIVAAVIDVWAIPLAGGIAVQFAVARDAAEWVPAALWTTALLVVVLPTAAEAASGRTVGKALRRIRVVSADGGRASVTQVVRRRSWTLPFLLQPILPGWYPAVFLVVLAAVIATMIRDPETRGLPDQLGGTRVLPDGDWILRVR